MEKKKNLHYCKDSSGNAEAIPGLGEVVKEIKDGDLHAEEGGYDASVEQWLPAPPDRPAKKMSLGMVASVLGSILLAVLFAFLEVGNVDVLRRAAHTCNEWCAQQRAAPGCGARGNGAG